MLAHGESYSQFLYRSEVMANNRVDRLEPPTVNGVADIFRLRHTAEMGQVPTDEAFRTRCPHLFSLLTNNRVDDHHWTEPARLTITNSNGDWLLGLSVPGAKAFAELLCSTLDEGLSQLDVALAKGALKWKYNLKRQAKPIRDREIEK